MRQERAATESGERRSLGMRLMLERERRAMEGECLVEMGDAVLWWRLGSLTASAPVLASLELHDRMLPGGGTRNQH